MFSSMKLSLKLSLGFGVLVALMLLSGGIALNALSSLNANTEQLATNWLPSVQAVGKFSIGAANVRRAELRMLLRGDIEHRQESIQYLAKSVAKFEEARAVYVPLISSPEEKALYEEFAKVWSDYLDESKKLVSLIDQGKIAEAMTESESASRKYLGSALDAAEKLVALNAKGAEDEAKAAEATYGRGRTLSLSIILLAGLLSAGIALVLIRGVMTQLGEDPGYLYEVSSQIAGGDLNVAFKKQKKEGGVYHVVQGMVQTMKAKIAEADQKTAEAAEQARLAGIATTEANEAKAQAERAKAEGMMHAATQLEKVVEVVSSASEELSAQIEQSSRGTEVQSQRVGETATAMEEMNATVLEVAKNASQAAESSANARTKALEGSKIVSQVVAGINTMQTVSLTMKEDMGALGKQAEGIGQVMNVISDIADQTNLLALNAAIEAARAGDAGRGFAVVADEVRKLAEKTMVATKEVGEAISGIQHGTKKNLENVERAVSTVEEATGLARKSGEALQEIVSLVEVATDQVRSIAAASEEQSAASEEINRSIEEINRISSETASAMNQSAQAVGELASQAGNLRALIEKMKSGA